MPGHGTIALRAAPQEIDRGSGSRNDYAGRAQELWMRANLPSEESHAQTTSPRPMAQVGMDALSESAMATKKRVARLPDAEVSIAERSRVRLIDAVVAALAGTSLPFIGHAQLVFWFAVLSCRVQKCGRPSICFRLESRGYLFVMTLPVEFRHSRCF
jgi:hypothetical protein